jgi:hypothetical protein
VLTHTGEQNEDDGDDADADADADDPIDLRPRLIDDFSVPHFFCWSLYEKNAVFPGVKLPGLDKFLYYLALAVLDLRGNRSRESRPNALLLWAACGYLYGFWKTCRKYIFW